MSSPKDELQALVSDYESYLTHSFNELWSKVPIDPIHSETFSVIGALLARQVTLSIQLARSPATWNGHAAPLFLRSQTDLHITVAWILGDLIKRARMYVLHGLGEEKLIIEQYKKEISDDPETPNLELIKQLIAVKSDWLSSQRHEWLVEVNLGHWAQLDTRTMAKEADCESLYKFAYKPFSHVAHNMWPHVSIYNSKQCENPLHRYHLIPSLRDAGVDIDYLYRSCKYVNKTYEAFIKRFDISMTDLLPIEWWNKYFEDKE